MQKPITPLFMSVWVFTLSVKALAILPSENIETDVLQATAQIRPLMVEPGAQGQITIEMNLAPNHHAYVDRFKLVVVEPSDILSIGEVKITPTIEFFDKVSKSKKQGIHDNATLSAVFEVVEKAPAGRHNIVLNLTYQACTNDYCLFPKTIQVPASIEIADTHAIAIPSTFQSALKLGLFWTFIFVFFAGMLTSLTPCIYPMIPITLAIIGSRGAKITRAKSFLLSLVYVFGIGLTYASLGVVAAMTGSLFGSALSSPWVTATISIMLVAMALSLFGFFEVRVPHFLEQRLSNKKTSGGYTGAFLSGLIAGIVASPCVGPVLVSLLTYIAQTQSPVLGFFLLFTFALGLGVLLIVVGTFSHVLNHLPKSGRWMVIVKTFFGILLLGAAIYYARPLFAKYLNFDLFSSSKSAKSTSLIQWQTFNEAQLLQAQKEGRPVIVDFWADWCEACHELDEHTFSDQEVIELSKKFLMIKFDATESTEDVTRITKKYAIVGLPTILFFNNHGKAADNLTLTGFEPASDFAKRMREALGEVPAH